MKLSTLFSFLLLLVAIQSTQAQATRELKDLSFMSGKWIAKTDWGDMEENWSEPVGNSMMCAYRCVKDGQVVFYEFIVIEQGPSGPVMKLRHFSPGNIAWEDKDKPYEYPLTFLDSDRARFERPDKKTSLTFVRVSRDKLDVTLERQDDNGKWVQDVFHYTLAE